MLEQARRLYAIYRCGKGRLPEPVCRYLRLFGRPLPRNRPLAEARFVVFDTETSGFDIVNDRIISIGAVGMAGNVISVGDSFELLIRQDAIGGREAVSVHGLLRKDLDKGADEADAALRFLDYIGDAILVAHHADYDIAMVGRILARNYGIGLFNEAIDTASFAKRLEKGPYYNLAHKSGEYRLDNLCERYGMRLYDRHTSAGDAYLTAQLFQRLLALGRKAGIDTVGKLLLK